MHRIKAEKRQKDQQKKQKATENRKHLANVRVVQRNLVFVVGLSPRLADPEVCCLFIFCLFCLLFVIFLSNNPILCCFRICSTGFETARVLW
jgi:hypothetical protein